MEYLGTGERIQSYFSEINAALRDIDYGKILSLEQKIHNARDSGSTVYIIGNGGSASAADHWACDLGKGSLNSYTDPLQQRLKIFSLATNLATMTAYANDHTYDEVYSQQLHNVLSSDDLLLILSASGNSPNILKAADVAQQRESYIFGLLGNDGGKVLSYCNDSIIVPSKNYGIIEDIHSMVCHLMTESLKGRPNMMD